MPMCQLKFNQQFRVDQLSRVYPVKGCLAWRALNMEIVSQFFEIQV